MRAQYISLKKIDIYGYVSILIFSMLLSCKTDKSELATNSNLQISLNGIEDYVEVDYTTKQSSTIKKSNITPTLIDSYDGFDAITSIRIAEPLVGDEMTKEASAIKKISVTTSKLDNTVRYRIVFYKISENTIVANQEIKVGDAPSIKLDAGVAYKWIAYSINQATVPTITNNVINKTDIANKDFLYATGNITMQYGDNYLNLTFKRYTTQYVVNVDVRGMFATFHNNTKVSISNGDIDLFKTANFNVLTGEFQGTHESIKINGSDLKAITSGVNDKKTATFYTIIESEVAIKDALKLNFAPLSIVMDKESEHPNGLIREFTTSTVDLKHNALSGASTRGRRYIIDAMLVESAVKVGTSTTEWARSNLWYAVDSTATGRYRFRVSPHQRDVSENNTIGQIINPLDLWKFNTTTPDGTSQTNGFDPCKVVYPNNLWKMPSDVNFNQLATPSKLGILDRGEPTFSIIGILANAKPYEMTAIWNKNATSKSADGYNQLFRTNDPMTTMNDLYLPGIGYEGLVGNIIYGRPNTTAAVNLLNAVKVLPIITGGGYYWTSKGLTENSTVKQPTYFMFSIDDGGLADVNVTTLVNISLLNFGNYTQKTTTDKLVGIVTLINENDAWKCKLNIRCVRNINYPNAPTY